jgi:WD40 repeat protein
MGVVTFDLTKLEVESESSDWYPLEDGQGDVRLSLKLTKQAAERQTQAASGVNFTASRPWAGSVFAPTGFDESAPVVAPEAKLSISYVYGYRSRSCRNNIRLLNHANKLIYHSAAIGIVHDLSTLKQTFYTGHRSSEILSLAVDPSGRYVATGDQVTNTVDGQKDVYIKVWEAQNPTETISTLECGKKVMGITSLAFLAPDESGESKYIVAIGTDPNHTVSTAPVDTSNLTGRTMILTVVPRCFM